MFGINITRTSADRNDSRLVCRFCAFIRIGLRIAEKVQQSRADDPVAGGQGMNTVAFNVGVASHRFDHALVRSAVYLLLVETELLEVRIDFVESAFFQSLFVFIGQAAMVQRRRCDGIANFLKAFVVVHQVGQTSVT